MTTHFLVWRKIDSRMAISILLVCFSAPFEQNYCNIAITFCNCCTIMSAADPERMISSTKDIARTMVQSSLASVVRRINWTLVVKH